LSYWLKGSALVLLGAFLWGTLAAFSKEASSLHPLTGATIRAGLAASGCFLWFGVRDLEILKVRLKDLIILFFYGGASAGFLYGGFMTALTYLSVAATEVIFFTFPLFTMFFGALILKERPSTMQVIAGILILIGVLSMATLTDSETTASSFPLPGVIAALLSVTGMTVQSLTMRWNGKTGWLQPWTLFSWAQFFAFIWLVFYKTLTTGWGDIPGLSGTLWGLLLYLGFVATLLGYGAYNLGLRYIRASTGSMLASFELITAVALAALLFQRVPSTGEILGCLIILVALVLSARGAQTTSCPPSSPLS